MKQKILVFIPAYRCEAQICRVLNQFDSSVQQWIDTVMVVDNQSPDQTLLAAIKCGKAALTDYNFIAWRNRDNYGLGGSHKAAFRYAIEQGFDYLVVLHGDDQANIHDLIPQLKAGAHLQVDCLLGARFMPGSKLKGYSCFRTFGNRVYNALFSLVTRKVVCDLGSGLNLYRLENFRTLYFKTFPDDLTFNYMMLLASHYHKQKIRFFPISWREEDQCSNVKLFHQAFKVLGLLAVYALKPGQLINRDLRGHAFDAYTGQIVYRHEK
jgi:glycosyltransferase involved in cell wall biosynthesis